MSAADRILAIRSAMRCTADPKILADLRALLARLERDLDRRLSR